MADIKGFFQKTKDSVSGAWKRGTDAVQKTVDSFVQKQADKKQNALDDYEIDINEAKKKIENDFVLSFLDRLGASVVPLNYKNAEKIKRVFPIPVEQTVVWADCEFDLRPSGVVITEKGVFIKTDISIMEEKIEKKRISELCYYTFEQFDPAFFVDEEDKENRLMQVDEKCIRRFFTACLKENFKAEEKRRVLAERSEKHFYRGNHVVNESVVTAAGIGLSGEEAIIRNNSAVNTQTGHGIMAEHANTLNDILHFKNAKVIGGDNAKNGADRLVNGELIQTKYCKTAARSVGAAFDNGGDGTYRYVNPQSGELMKLEVPSDQYEAALRTMNEKIQAGKVLTVDQDGNRVAFDGQAEEIVTKGHYTYEQACNLAKAGTYESLKYDMETGAVVGLGVFGITFLINTFLSYQATHDKKEAVKDGLKAGGKASLLTIGNHVAISQLSRTAWFKDVISSNAIKSGAVTGVVSFFVFSIPETYKLATKKISLAQYAVNLLCLSASIAGGIAGGLVGSTLATGAGATAATVAAAGAMAGFAGGIAIGALATAGLSVVYEGDDAVHTRLFNAITVTMMGEYLLSESEMDAFIDSMNKTDAKLFKTLYDKLGASRHQEKMIRDFLTPYFEAIIQKRIKIDFDPYGVEIVE